MAFLVTSSGDFLVTTSGDFLVTEPSGGGSGINTPTELAAADARRLHMLAFVDLYRALGGGWDPVTDTLAIPHPAR